MKTHHFACRAVFTIFWLGLCGFNSHHQKWPTTTNKARKKTVIITEQIPDQIVKPALNLSLPTKTFDTTDSYVENRNNTQAVVSDLFAKKPQKKPSAFQLKGDIIESLDPQIEKRKSFDGASIILNIKQ